jgi:hypothetical protein
MPPRTTTTSSKAARAAAAKPASARPAAARKRKGTASESLGESERRRLIAEAAYFKAERRGFAAGGELEDWIEAEAEIDALLDSRGAG